MYRMLTGAPPHYQSTPFSEGNLEAQLAAYRKLILNAPKPNGHRKILGVDPELASIIDRCLETSPSKRFANPQEVVSALDAWQLRRVRRPLLILSALGFSLLFIVLAINGAYVFWTSVNTAEHGVIDRALKANDATAESEAGQLAFQTQLRWLQLEAAARTRKSATCCSGVKSLPPIPALVRSSINSSPSAWSAAIASSRSPISHQSGSPMMPRVISAAPRRPTPCTAISTAVIAIISTARGAICRKVPSLLRP